MKPLLRRWFAPRLRSVRRPRPLARLEVLEDRVVPTTDLILDFDGGTLQANQGYVFVPGAGTTGGNTFTGFQPFAASGSDGTADRNEQILQILAGVRQDFADFDVRVLWDDRGVSSPLFDGHDTVILVSGNSGPATGILSVAPLDLSGERDAGVAFAGSVNVGNAGFDVSQLVLAISYAAARSFGVSDSTQLSLDTRQIVTQAPGDPAFDHRFSHTPVNHAGAEAGSVYAEYDRLKLDLGLAPAGSTQTADEAHTNLTLLGDTPVTNLDATHNATFLPFDAIDHNGDRDAFQITLPFSGSYTIRERAAVGAPAGGSISNIDPVLTLWDFDGDFLGVGTTGTAAGVSEITFDAVAGKTYFVVAGTGFDRVISNPAANTINGAAGTPSQGPYAIEIAPSWATLNTATRQIIVTGDGTANTITSVLSGTDVRVDFGGEHIQVPAAQVVGMQFNGGAGDDDYEFDLDGLPPMTITDSAGNDTMTVISFNAAGVNYAVTPTRIVMQGGPTVNFTGVEDVTVDGSPASDTFTVTPSLTTTFHIDGQDPTTSPGDTLHQTSTAAVLTVLGPTSGRYTFVSGEKPVDFTNVETFDRPPPPVIVSSLAGRVFLDANRNGVFDAGDTGIGGVALTLTRGGGSPATFTASTAADGSYRFGNLPAGAYALSEAQPAGFLNGSARAGTAGGVVTGDTINGINLGANVNATGYDFGELPPGPPPPPPHVPISASFAVGAGPGLDPFVSFFRTSVSVPTLRILAYDPGFRGGVRVAVGDVTGDGVPDIVTAPGRGGGPDVRVFNGRTGQLVRAFLAYDPGFAGGVFVAAGDVNGDGLADIVTGADAGGGPHVKVFSGKDGSVLQSFFAFSPTFTGGVRVAAQDINGDGRADIVTGAGPGGAPVVEAFSGANGQLLFSAMAYAPNFTGGVYVAAGDVNRDGRADIITGAGEGGGPHVKVFSGANGQTLMSFLGFPVSTLGSSQFVGDAGWTSGVRVAVVGMNGGTDIVVAPGPGHANRVRALNVLSLTEDGSFQAADPAFLGGIFLGS